VKAATAITSTTPKGGKKASPPSPATGNGLVQGWLGFWFTPGDPIALHMLRILAGLLFLAWLLPFAGHLDSFFALEGWFDYREIPRMAEEARRRGEEFNLPKPIDWSLLLLVGSNPAALRAFYWISLGVIVLFTLGIYPRVTAVLTYLAVASFTVNPALDFDADSLLVLLSFYLMVGYVLWGQLQPNISLPERFFGTLDSLVWRRSAWVNAPEQGSVAANVAVRLIQVHFAVAILISGLHKLQFGDWWAGVAFWYPLYPPFETSLTVARSHAGHAEAYLGVLSIAVYLTLVWQIGFPLYAWKPSWRMVLLAGGVAAWLGNAFLYGLPLFGPVILICCLSYLTAEEWRRYLGWVAARFHRWLPAPHAESVSEEPAHTEKSENASLVPQG
jgi:hypothetical protein